MQAKIVTKNRYTKKNSDAVRKIPDFLVRVISQQWQSSLAKRFAIVSLAVFLVGMLIIGQWVSLKIQNSVIENTALSAALYLNSIVAPELAELATGDKLSEQTISRLDQLYWDTPLNERIEAVKLWGQDGLVLYSTSQYLRGQRFPVTPGLTTAWEGGVHAEFTGEEHPENILERRLGVPLLEMYTPVRVGGSNRIVAVAEFYDNASTLRDNLAKARLSSWLFVGGLTSAMFLALFGIVRRGSKTIIDQQEKLHQQVHQLSNMLSQNQALHQRVREATDRIVELNEVSLRRLGRELHDGPAQIISYGLLRLDSLIPDGSHKQPDTSCIDQSERDKFRESLAEALQEIRDISAGLAIPELDKLTLHESLSHVVNTHRRRTGTEVMLDVQDLPDRLKLPAKIALYRIVQEALNNACKHGNGQQQCVVASSNGHSVTVKVTDAGPGFVPVEAFDNGRLGLSGMRERIESLGGQFSIQSAAGKGTVVTATMPFSG